MKSIILIMVASIFLITGCNASSPPSSPTPQPPAVNQNGNHSTSQNLPPERPQVGFLAPGFSLPNLKNEMVTLGQYKGKPLILVFWVLDCEACMEELPVIQAFYEKQGSSHINIVTISVGESFKTINEFILENKFTFPVLLDESADVCIKYERGAPTTFFLDKDGIVLRIRDEVFHSVDDIESIIAEIYK